MQIHQICVIIGTKFGKDKNMKKIEILITDEKGDICSYDVTGLFITNLAESYRYHTLAARQTLYPNKSIEEVQIIINENIEKWQLSRRAM